MNTKELLSVTIAITTMFAVSSSLDTFSMTEILFTSKTAFAQAPPAPSLPDRGDLTTDNQLPDTNSQPQLSQSATPTGIPPPTIQITSHQDGNQVPVGELTIQGTSSDNQESNCQVYADVNDIAPLQNATAAGANGVDDYSQWTFTFKENYQLITQGVNELTAKISCFDNGGSATIPVSEWHSVNVTGVASGGATSIPTPTPTPTMTQTPTTAEALEAGQGSSIPSSPITSPAVPFTTLGEPSEDSSQGLVEEEQSGGGDDGDDGDDDGDDEGDDGDDEDDDGGEEDDG